jgi:CheY-like chemotaxis protein
VSSHPTPKIGPIRILTADDHPLLRYGIAALVGTEPDMELVAQASTGQEAIEQFRLHQPDVTLMDLQMPGMNGIEATIGIRSEFPNARIIVLTTYAGDVQAMRALKAGARAAPQVAPVAPQFIGVGAGMFLLVGLWTPLVGALIAMVELWVAFSYPGDPSIPIMLAVLGVSLAMVGPGEWSIDARLFGRKHIHTPDLSRGSSSPARNTPHD